MPLKHDEEVKASVADEIYHCDECRNSYDGFCEEHLELIRNLNQKEDFDVADYAYSYVEGGDQNE